MDDGKALGFFRAFIGARRALMTSEDGKTADIATGDLYAFCVANFRLLFGLYRRFLKVSFDRTRVSSAFGARDRARRRYSDGR